MSNRTPIVLDLFAGAGGASLGLHRAGWHHAAAVEWDASAAATLRAAGICPVIHGDVRDVTAEQVGSIDLLWASPPCQAFSTAGQRKGAADDRNGWPWTWEAVDRLRPTWLVAENVPGLLHHSSAGCGDPMRCPGCYWRDVVLPEFRRRFAVVQWRILNAADYGVPQRRLRVFLVCGPRAIDWPAPTHADQRQTPDLFAPALPPWRTVREALGMPIVGGGTRGNGVAEWRPEVCDETPAPCVTGFGSTGGLYADEWLRLEQTGAQASSVSEPAPTVSGVGNLYAHGAHPGARPAPAITCGKGNGTSGNKMRDHLQRAIGRRRLTVAECAALQAFPADWPWQGNQDAQYRQVGNAVPPPVAEAIGRAVLAAIDTTPR